METDSRNVSWLLPFSDCLSGDVIYYGKNYDLFNLRYRKYFINTKQAVFFERRNSDTQLLENEITLVADEVWVTKELFDYVVHLKNKKSKRFNFVALLKNPIYKSGKCSIYQRITSLYKLFLIKRIIKTSKLFWVYDDGGFSKEIIFSSIDTCRQESKTIKTAIKGFILNYIPILLSQYCVVTNNFSINIIGNKKVTRVYKNDNIYLLESVLSMTGRAFYFVREMANNKKEEVLIIPQDQKSLRGRKNEYEIISSIRQKDIWGKEYFPNITKYENKKYTEVIYVQNKFQGIAFSVAPKEAEKVLQNAAYIYTKIVTQTKSIISQDIFQNLVLNILHKGINKYYPNKKEIFKEVIDHIVEDYKDITEMPVHLMHGDFKMENIIVDKKLNNVLGIIDWEFSRIEGIPLIDMIYIWLNYCVLQRNTNIKEEYHKLLRNYVLHEKLPTIIQDYITKVRLKNEQIRLLMLSFIIHHYFVRLSLFDNNLGEINQCILIAVKRLKER